MHRPPGQIDAFVSSDEGSDMDVSESEADEPTITQPFTAVAPSDYRSPSNLPSEGSFVSNMRSYAAQQAQDPSNRIVTPRVEHFNNESNPIQVDSDSDDESASSFHTAPSSPREEDNSNDELELEIAKITESIEKNNCTIMDIRAEIVSLEKQKSDLNLEILESKVRNSISTRKRTAQRETPKPAQSGDAGIADSTHAAANQNKGKERAHPYQPSPLRHRVPTQTQSHATAVATPQRVIVQPSSQRQRNNTNGSVLAPNKTEKAKDTNLKRRADEKQIQKNTKRLRNIELRNDMRTEKKKDAMEINRAATELAISMAKDSPMEEGELTNTSSDDDGSDGGNSPIVQAIPKNVGTKVVKTQTAPMHHTQKANRNNFQPYKSALSSIGLGPSPVTSSNSEDKPLCTFEQNGGTCNNDSCQAAHFRDFL